MGPVGMTAALILAQRGIQVTVLEGGADLAVESRASTFHPPSLEILDDLGVLDELLELGLKAPGFQYRGHNRELLAHLDMSVLSEDTNYPFRIQCEQSKLTRIIRRHLEQMPNVTLRFDAPVEKVEVGTDAAYLYLPGDGRDASYVADWVIGADGASSAVRHSLGIAFEGVTYPERFLVASTTHEFRNDIEDLAFVSYVYDPDDWGVLLRTPSHWRVLFPIPEDESDEDAIAPERIEQRLQGVIALDEPYPVVHSTIYAVHQRLAATFGVPHVLLAGDAAHINNPLGGMGMNSGIQDAHAAAQAIVYALDGGDPARAASTYARVRRDAAAVDVQKNTQKNYEEMRERDSAQRLNRKTEMAEIAADPERARAYLRGTSMLASFETSRRRMTTALTPVTGGKPLPSGQKLSDSVRDGSLLAASSGGSTLIKYLRGAVTPADGDDLLAFTRQSGVPIIAALDQADPQSIAGVVRHFEHGDVAAVVIPDAGRLTADVVAAAISARRDLLVIAALPAGTGERAGEGPGADLPDAARSLAAAGADLVGVVGAVLADLQAIHKAIPGVPLALIADSDAPLPTLQQLTLAGVTIILESADVPALV